MSKDYKNILIELIQTNDDEVFLAYLYGIVSAHLDSCAASKANIVDFNTSLLDAESL